MQFKFPACMHLFKHVFCIKRQYRKTLLKITIFEFNKKLLRIEFQTLFQVSIH